MLHFTTACQSFKIQHHVCVFLICRVCLFSIELILSSAPLEEDTDGDVGLQLKVNFPDKAVQRNARLAGKWGKPETTLSFFPFAPGESFKVCVKSFKPLVDSRPESLLLFSISHVTFNAQL